MNQSIVVESAPKNKRLVALLYDVLFIGVSTVALFFLLLYAIIGPIFSYQDNCNTYVQYREQYQLNYGNDRTYEEYDAVIKKYYFEYFPTQIYEDVEKEYPGQYKSIGHIYNVTVLNLPMKPSASGGEYKSDLFEYQISENGEVLINEPGIKRKDKEGGSNYAKYIRSHMSYQYSDKLPGLLNKYVPAYQNANRIKHNVEYASRVTSVSISVIVFAIVLPIVLKNGQTLGCKLNGIGYVNYKNKTRMQWYKNIFRALVLYTLPVVGFGMFNRYGIIIFMVAPIFASILLMLFKESGNDLQDSITRTYAVDIDNSLIFGSLGEASLYAKDPDHQKVEDEDYLKALESVETFDLSVSRDEIIEKDEKNKK